MFNLFKFNLSKMTENQDIRLTNLAAKASIDV
jgi:hypothetical protein